jgi:hypothetical protein
VDKTFSERETVMMLNRNWSFLFLLVYSRFGDVLPSSSVMDCGGHGLNNPQ